MDSIGGKDVKPKHPERRTFYIPNGKYYNFIKEYPLKVIDKFYGEVLPLEELLKAGLGNELKTNSGIELCLGILNEFIPNPPLWLEELCEGFNFKQNYFRSENNVEILDKLVDETLEVVLRAVREYWRPLMPQVLIKMLHFASKITLIKHISEIRKYFEYFCTIGKVRSYCTKKNHIFIASFIILERRLPYVLFEYLLTDNVICTIQIIKSRNCEKACPLIAILKNWSIKHLDNLLTTKTDKWVPLIDMCQKFKTSETASALTMFASLMEKMPKWQPLLIIDSLSHLDKLLSNPDQDRITLTNIKTFLTTFVKFEYKENHYAQSANRGLFRNLLNVLHYALDEVMKILIKIVRNGLKMHGDCVVTFEETVKLYLNDAFIILRILRCLSVLNESWYQWFDLERGNPIIDAYSDSFDTDEEEDPITFCNHGTFRWNDCGYGCTTRYFPILIKMIQVCPLVVNLKLKEECLNHISDTHNIDDQVKRFTVTKNHILHDVKKILDENKEIEGPQWQFKINKSGPGHNTSEVYRLASYGLMLKNKLWQECIFQKYMPCETKETLASIGKLFAKIYLDRYYLSDFPFGVQLVRHIEHNHLIKGYYEISQTLPAVGGFIKRLVEIKRRKETIELRDGGKDIKITPFDVEVYLESLATKRLQMQPYYQIIKESFEQYAPGIMDLKLKLRKTFKRLTTQDLKTSVLYEYTATSEPVQFLFEVLNCMNNTQQAKFKVFVLGTYEEDRYGRNRNLVIEKLNSNDPDNTIPTIRRNRVLQLPEYSSLEITRQRILQAIENTTNPPHFNH